MVCWPLSRQSPRSTVQGRPHYDLWWYIVQLASAAQASFWLLIWAPAPQPSVGRHQRLVRIGSFIICGSIGRIWCRQPISTSSCTWCFRGLPRRCWRVLAQMVLAARMPISCRSRKQGSPCTTSKRSYGAMLIEVGRKKKDSEEHFTTNNYRITTTPKVEYELIAHFGDTGGHRHCSRDGGVPQEDLRTIRPISYFQQLEAVKRT